MDLAKPYRERHVMNSVCLEEKNIILSFDQLEPEGETEMKTSYATGLIFV